MALTRAEIAARYRARHPDRVKAEKIAAKERDRKWRAENRERLNALSRKSYTKHRETILEHRKAVYDKEYHSARGREYYEKNKDILNAKKKAWRIANPEKCALLAASWKERNKERYRARSASYGADRFRLIKKATPAWANQFFMREIYHLAQLRTKHSGIVHHVDHYYPIQSDVVCGLHVENNLRVIPGRENIIKRNTLRD